MKICKLPVDAGPDDKKRERAAHKLELCPKEYLPIIEAAIDGGSVNAASVFSWKRTSWGQGLFR